MTPTRPQFWINRGGTFTDMVARTPERATVTVTLRSEDPGRYADGAMLPPRFPTAVIAGNVETSQVAQTRCSARRRSWQGRKGR